ncbi:MAG: tyrosine-type recombinase/integrase [Acidimicrobiales bacterium]
MWLFSPNAGHDRPWTPSAWSSRWRKVRMRAEAVDVRFHDLRHFYATELLDDGTPEATVSAMLGHESIATLQKVYAHRAGDCSAGGAGVG